MANRWTIWGPAAAWAAVLFFLSAIPDIPGVVTWPPHADKVAHLGLYGVLGAALGFGWARSPRPVRHLLLLGIGALYGVTDEIHQVYVPGRTPDVADWAADVVGVLVGYGVVVALLGRRGRADDEKETGNVE